MARVRVALLGRLIGKVWQIVLLALILDAMGSVSQAQTTSEERWEGYRRLDSPEVAALDLSFQEFAENAIFEIQTLVRPETPSGRKYEVVDVKNEPMTVDPKVLNIDLRAQQIETCRKQDLRVCPLFVYNTRGTLFFNDDRFVTCRHGFHNWLVVASRLNGNRSLYRISPPIILRNSSGDIVYNSAWIDRPLLEFITINDHPGLSYITDFKSLPSANHVELSMQTDYVEMILNDELFVHDYNMAERTAGYDDLYLNEEIYILGYAGKTNVFPGRVGDAPGHKLMMSNGRALKAVPEAGALKTTNFTSPGTSGGPVLTALGEIAGVSCRGDVDKLPEGVQSYPIPISAELVKQHWLKLPYPTAEELAATWEEEEQRWNANISANKGSESAGKEDAETADKKGKDTIGGNYLWWGRD